MHHVSIIITTITTIIAQSQTNIIFEFQCYLKNYKISVLLSVETNDVIKSIPFVFDPKHTVLFSKRYSNHSLDLLY